MKKMTRFAVLSLAVMAFSAFGLQAAPVSGQDNELLEKQIYKKIISLPYYGVFDSIGFEIDGDTVILTGKVINGVNRKAAAKRVAKIEGVNNVVNNIDILPPSSFDDRIRRRTVRSLANTGGLYRYLISPNPSMRIIVENGRLSLVGYVNSKSDVRLANIIAQGIPGVFSVLPQN